MTDKEIVHSAPARKEQAGVGVMYETGIDGWVGTLQRHVNEYDYPVDDISELRPATITRVEVEYEDMVSETLIRDDELPNVSEQGTVALEAQLGKTISVGLSYFVLIPSQDCAQFEEVDRWEIEYDPDSAVQALLDKNYLNTNIFDNNANGWYRSRMIRFLNEAGKESQDPLIWEGAGDYSQERDETKYEKWLLASQGEEVTEDVTPTTEITRRQELLNMDWSDLCDEARDAGIENPEYEPATEVVEMVLDAEGDN